MANYTEYFNEYLATNTLPAVLGLMPDDDNGMTFTDRFIDRNKFKEIGAETETLFSMYLEAKAEETVNKYKWKIEKYKTERENLFSRITALKGSRTNENSGTDTTTRDGSTGVTNASTQSTGDTKTTTANGDDTQNQYYNPVVANITHASTGDTTDNIVNKTTEHSETGETTTDSLDTTVLGLENTERSDTDKTEYGKKTTETWTEERLYNAKPDVELMEATLKLENIYEEALANMDVLFMGIL